MGGEYSLTNPFDAAYSQNLCSRRVSRACLRSLRTVENEGRPHLSRMPRLSRHSIGPDYFEVLSHPSPIFLHSILSRVLVLCLWVSFGRPISPLLFSPLCHPQGHVLYIISRVQSLLFHMHILIYTIATLSFCKPLRVSSVFSRLCISGSCSTIPLTQSPLPR